MKRTRPATTTELKIHARELASAFDVKILEIAEMPPEYAMAATLFVKAIVAAPVTDETTYATQLHELGHCLHPSGNLQDESALRNAVRHGRPVERNMRVAMDEEIAAWEWAEHYALDWTVAMEHVKQLSLQSYIEGTKAA